MIDYEAIEKKIQHETLNTNYTWYDSPRDIRYLAIHYSASTHSKRGSALDSASWFNVPGAGGSADYIVDQELFVQLNDNIAHKAPYAVGGARYNTQGGGLYGIAKNANTVSIEMASDNSTGKMTYPNDPHYSLNQKVIDNALQLAAYLMKKYNIPIDRVVRHYDISGKECPGVIGWNKESGDESKWIDFKNSLAKLVNDEENPAGKGTHASDVNKLSSEEEKAEKILKIVRPIAESYKLFPSVATAQCILESGYCGTELALNADNICGMKATLSNNDWSGSTWGGRVYSKLTQEQRADGSEYTVKADFRAYDCIEDSIKDRCAYLINAKNGTKRRYPKIRSCLNALEQVTLIRNGGYATDTKYVAKIMNIISRFDLDRFDKAAMPYTIQAGAFAEKENALAAIEKLKEKNLNAIYTYTNCFKVILTNSYALHSEAELVLKLLHDLGFDAFIKQ